jgi:hypothetical protein
MKSATYTQTPLLTQIAYDAPPSPRRIRTHRKLPIDTKRIIEKGVSQCAGRFSP